MKRITSQDKTFAAWIEVPDEWLSGHYHTYIGAYYEAVQQDETITVAAARLAGILTLIIKGICRAEIAGLDLGNSNLETLSAKALGFLVRHIAISLEATQTIPFLSEPVSVTGLTAATKDE